MASPGGAAAAQGSRPWRATAAPANMITLSNYVMQPDPTDDGDAEEDTTDVGIDKNIPDTETPTTNQPGQSNPNFGRMDSTGRLDSLFSIPKAAPTNVGSSGLPAPAGAAAGQPAAKMKRGVLGLHPAFLLVGLIALHIFVVTVAGK